MKEVYRNQDLKVVDNGSGELLISPVRSNPREVEIRVSSIRCGMKVTAQYGELSPWAENGRPAFRAMKPYYKGCLQ